MPVASQSGRTEAAPSKSEREFRHLLEILPAAAYTCDSDGLITFFNTRAAQLWGREPRLNDPVDRFCGSFKLFTADGKPIEHAQCWMALALHDDKEYDGREIVIERPDGTRLNVLAYANPWHDDCGNLSGGVNVLVDVTDRKRAEDEWREADRHKDEFLTILAHELRNPLAPLRHAVELLRLDGDNEATREQARALMERQLHQLVRLVDDLLDVSRLTRHKLVLRRERVELAAVVRSAVESARSLIEAAGHELRVTLPPQPVYLDADRTRLAQVFANLLNNAAKYTERGGRIWLTAAVTGGEVVVKVGDNGIGIPAEMLPQIFDIFTQVDRSLERSQGGLGLGLSLVRGLVEMHGGTIAVCSDGPGRGSEFSVHLPILRGYHAVEHRANGHGKTTACRCRVLVVDDNKDSAASLSKLLRLIGNEVHTAHDGQEAVDAAAAFKPNVVLLDIGLPKINGYDAAKKMREQSWGREMFLIALTGWGQEEDRRRSIEAGFNLHLVKPIEPAELASLLAGLHRSTA
jgi:PAS domain S-box-containing protein